MNAIIGLCHFCDSHGPRTLFCTQAFKFNETTKNSLKQKSEHQNTPQLTSLASINVLNRSHSIHQINHQQQSHANDPLASPSSLFLSPNSATKHNQESVNSTCKACRAFESGFHHYISYENEKNTCYVSQSTPTDSEVFALVRKACLRTLHCEVFEDSIYFDDDKDGSVIGYEFNIKDSEGRGMQRSYSLIVIMKDRIYLQQLMSFLSKQLALIASNIKKEAEKKFDKDMKLLDAQITNNSGGNSSLAENLTNIKPSSTNNPSALLTASASLTSSQRQTLYTKKSSKSLEKRIRGLIELTDDTLIFAKLHMWFTWILRISHFQLVEEFMHAGLSEDLQVKFERDELEELYAESINSNSVNKFMHKKKIIDISLPTKLLKLQQQQQQQQQQGDTIAGLCDEKKCDEHEQLNELLLKNFRVGNLRQLLKVNFAF